MEKDPTQNGRASTQRECRVQAAVAGCDKVWISAEMEIQCTTSVHSWPRGALHRSDSEAPAIPEMMQNDRSLLPKRT